MVTKQKDPLSGSGSIEIKINRRPFEFDDHNSRLYATIGYVATELASLEHALDEFAFLVSQKHPKLAVGVARHFPSTYAEKIDFLIDVVIELPALRTCGDEAGVFDLNLIAYGLEETLAFRNVFIHSTMDFIQIEPDRFVCRVVKFSRTKGDRRRFAKEKYEYSSGFLERVVDRSRYFRSLLWRLTARLNGDDVSRMVDQVRRGQAEWRDLVRRLEDQGYVIDDAA